MARVGKVEILVDFDGRRLPRQAKQLGRQVGNVMGQQAQQRFDERFSGIGQRVLKNMRRDGTLGGISLADGIERGIQSRLGRIRDKLSEAFTDKGGLDRYAKNFTSVDDAVRSLADGLDELRGSGNLTQKDLDRLNREIKKWEIGAREVESATRAKKSALDDLKGSLDRQVTAVDRVNAAYNDRLKRTMRETKLEIRDIDHILSSSTAWRRYERETGGTARAFENVERRIRAARGVSVDFDIQLDRSADRSSNLASKMQKLTDVVNRQGEAVSGSGFKWRNLSHNMRQWVLIIGAVIAAGEKIATLGSAVGAGGTTVLLAAVNALATLGSGAGVGLALIGGSLGSVVLGAGAAALALVGLNDNLANLGEEAQRSVGKIKGLGGELAGIRTRLQDGLFTDAFADNLEQIVGNWLPAIESGAAKALEGFQRLADELANGERWAAGPERLATLLDGLGEMFDELLIGSFDLGGAIGNIFIAGLPTLQRFADDFAAMMERFNTWTGSLDGQNQIAEWFERGYEILTDVKDAISEISDDMAEIVTPETIAQLDKLLGAVTNITGAIAAMSGVAEPFITRFTGYIERITGKFEAWTRSFEGQNALEEWFSNGETVLKSFEGLLVETGKALAGLVDEESVSNLTGFLDNLAGAMPFVERLLDTVGQLDIFGLVALALNEVGDAIAPLLGLLAPVFDLMNSSAEFTIPALGAAIDFLLGPLTPFGAILTGLTVAFNLWEQAIATLQPYFQPLQDAIFGVDNKGGTLADKITGKIMPAFQRLLDKIIEFLPEPEEMARIFEEEVMPAIDKASEIMIETLVPALINAMDAATEFLDGLGGFDGIKRKLEIVGKAFEILGYAIATALGGPLATILGLISAVNRLNGMSINAPRGLGDAVPRTAVGGVFNGLRTRIIGEAGPEAVVPLRRPLSQVDPSVRDLSAYAQGITNSNNSSRVTRVERGAITVLSAPDAGLTAEAVLDRIAADAAI